MSRPRAAAALGLGALLVAAVVGCQDPPASDPPAVPTTSLAATASAAATPAPMPAPMPMPMPMPERIVSTAPSTTEILFALGVGNRVVGVTRFCDYPPEAATRSKVGGFLDLSYEAVVTLRPDLLVGTRNGSNRDVVDRVAGTGVATVFPPAGTLAETYEAVLAIGGAVGAQEQADRLVAEMRREVTRISGSVAGATAPGTLMVYGHRPLVVAGPGTFADELIALAGGRNVVDRDAIRYPTLPLEEVVRLAPDVIIDTLMVDEAAADTGSPFEAFPSIPAVANGRVVRMALPELMRPGPRLVTGLERIARLLHPGTTAKEL